MPKTTDALEAETAQRDAAKTEVQRKARRATLDKLRGKKPAEREIPVVLDDDDDPVSFLLRAIGLAAYDELVAKYPPTTAQRAEGQTYNVKAFAPALLSRVVVEPEMSVKEWEELLDSPAWGRGEFMSLFWAAEQLCNRGLDLAPFARD